MLKLKPEEMETTMTTVILGKFKYMYVQEWTRLVESCNPNILNNFKPYKSIKNGLFHPKKNIIQ